MIQQLPGLGQPLVKSVGGNSILFT